MRTFRNVPMGVASHCGVVVIALRQPNGPAIVAELRKILPHLQENTLSSKVLLLTGRRSYLR